MDNNLGYLFAAYTIAWAVIFTYVAWLGSRLTELETRMPDDDGDDAEK